MDYLLTSPVSFCTPTCTDSSGVDVESDGVSAGRRVSCRTEPRENQLAHNKSRADYLIRSGHNSPIPSGSSCTITRAMNHRRHSGKTAAAASARSSEKSECTSLTAAIQWEG